MLARRLQLAALVVVIAPLAAAGAPAPAAHTYVAVQAAYAFPNTGDLSPYDGGLAVAGAVGWWIDPSLGIELDAARFALRRSETVGSGPPATWRQDVVAVPVMLSIRPAGNPGPFEVYGVGGAGVLLFSSRLRLNGTLASSESRAVFALQVGGGVSFRVLRRVAVGVEGKIVGANATLRTVPTSTPAASGAGPEQSTTLNTVLLGLTLTVQPW